MLLLFGRNQDFVRASTYTRLLRNVAAHKAMLVAGLSDTSFVNLASIVGLGFKK